MGIVYFFVRTINDRNFDSDPRIKIFSLKFPKRAISIDSSRSNSKCLGILSTFGSKTLSVLFLHRKPERFIIWTQIDSHCRFSPKILTSFFFRVSAIEFLLLLEYANKNYVFSSIQWNLEGPKLPESVVGLDMLRYSNSNLLTLPASFFRQMSNENFLLEVGCSFLNIRELVLYIKIGIPIDQIRKSAISFEISRYSNNLSFSKTTRLKFLAKSELTFLYFQMLIKWNNHWFCSFLWKSKSWTCENF